MHKTISKIPESEIKTEKTVILLYFQQAQLRFMVKMSDMIYLCN